jgi:hypothetical protein
VRKPSDALYESLGQRSYIQWVWCCHSVQQKPRPHAMALGRRCETPGQQPMKNAGLTRPSLKREGEENESHST